MDEREHYMYNMILRWFRVPDLSLLYLGILPTTSAWPFVWETIASGTPAASWSCRKKWDLPDEGAPDGCGWNHIFDLLLSRILTVCAQQELHLRQEDAYSDGIK